MSLELILGLVGLVLGLVGGGVGWAQIRKHGEVRRERDELEERNRQLEEALGLHQRGDASPGVLGRVLRDDGESEG